MGWKNFNIRKLNREESEDIEKKRIKRDHKVNWITAVVIFILVLCVVASCIVFIHTCSSDLKHERANEEWHENTCNVYLLSHVVDTTKNLGVFLLKNNNGTVDTLRNSSILSKNEVDRIINGQKIVMERQDAMVQDMRQESNNLINKMNGWLAFWLGIMAVIGVFVPVALQFKLYRERRDEDLEYKEKLDERTNEFEKRSRSLEYATLVRNFQYVFDSPEIRTKEFKGSVLEGIWKEIVGKLRDIIEDYLTHRCDTKAIQDLTVALVLTTNVLSLIRSFTPRKIRNVSGFISETTGIINAINGLESDKENIRKRLEDYYDRLRAFRITW